MARYQLTLWDDDEDVFEWPGPLSGDMLWERLGRHFPDDATAIILHADGRREETPWRHLRQRGVASEERLELPGNPTGAGPLLYVMSRLLGPEGCPWDRQQTSMTLLRYLLDEGYEAAEALVAQDMEAFQDELGDVLLQVVFHGALLEDTSFAEIAVQQARKLIRRHPHVFGETPMTSSEEVRQSWEALKTGDPERRETATWVYPSLVMAKRAGKMGKNPQTSVYQEIMDRLQVYFTESQGKIEEILADAAWAVAEVGRIHHRDAEWALWQRLVETFHQNAETPRNLG